MQISKLNLSLLALVLTFVWGLAACSSNPGKELTTEQKLAERKYTLGKTVDRLENYRITGFNSLDDYHVIIHSSPTRSYLVTVRMRCHNLDTAENIAFSTTVGSVTRHDKLLVRSGAAGYTEQCFIDTLQELNKVTPS